MALFNHDTSRDQDPQLHTHVVVANVTQHNGEWKTLSSDKVGENRIFRERASEPDCVREKYIRVSYVSALRRWVMKPKWSVSTVCGRCRAYRWRRLFQSFTGYQGGRRSKKRSLKSRDVAALDTRKSKQHVDPEIRMAEWMQTLKETGFDIRAYRDTAESACGDPHAGARACFTGRAGCAAGGDTGDCRIK